jgi:ankyrin repeat protein
MAWHSLQLAVAERQLESARLLLQAGFQVDMLDIQTGNSALHCLCDLSRPAPEEQLQFQTDTLAMTQLLLDNSADIKLVNTTGNSALMHLIYSAWNVPLLELLLANLPQDDTWLGEHTNSYGCSLMVS